MSSLRNNFAFVSTLATQIDISKRIDPEATYFYQFLMIMRRNFIVSLRIPILNFVKIFIPVAVAGLVALMFHGVSGTFMGVRNRNGVLFFTDVAIGYIGMQFTCNLFPHERPIFLREIGNHMYSVGPYFLGRYFAELPSSLIIPSLFGTTIYFIVGLDLEYWWKFPLFSKL